jgi:hypothetical protein
MAAGLTSTVAGCYNACIQGLVGTMLEPRD